ncbi:MAG: hypothetical protein J2P53_02985 [Bradyrhizobiaceae bacterium]|nr:hypothetical protein [Bradyrhizobiaceae bacterium]
MTKSGKSPLPLALEFLIVIGFTYGAIAYGQLQFAFRTYALQDVFNDAHLQRRPAPSRASRPRACSSRMTARTSW